MSLHNENVPNYGTDQVQQNFDAPHYQGEHQSAPLLQPQPVLYSTQTGPDQSGLTADHYQYAQYLRYAFAFLSFGMTTLAYSIMTKIMGNVTERDNYPLIKHVKKVDILVVAFIYFVLFLFGFVWLAPIFGYMYIGQNIKAKMMTIHFFFYLFGVYHAALAVVLFMVGTLGLGFIVYFAYLIIAQVISIVYIVGTIMDIAGLIEKCNSGQAISQFEYASPESFIAASYGQVNLQYSCCSQVKGLNPCFVAPKITVLPTSQ